MDSQVSTEVLAALGLDVVDVHLTDGLNTVDLDGLRTRLSVVQRFVPAPLELVSGGELAGRNPVTVRLVA